MQDEIALRAIATRLTITPVEELPRISGFLASSLAQCSLKDHISDNKKAGSSSVAAHKLKTRITSLLQDRSAAGRLTAAVLIKAVVDNGGSNVLSNSEVWARGLLSCLSKPDTTDVKKIYLVTITRIFLLTQNHPTLLREVTTPLLPPFITSCLGLIKPFNAQIAGKSTEVANPLLDSVLQCWIQLLPQHATLFRPFLTRIRLACQSLLQASEISPSTKDLVINLVCLLISCAPKNTVSQEWSQTASSIVNIAHQIADKVFRTVIEEYEPNDTSYQRPFPKHNFSKEPTISEKDSLGLGAWTGLYEGSGRLTTLIGWMGGLVSISTSHAVTVPVGSILDLTSRLLAVIPPGSRSNTASALRYHDEASREEKEQLCLSLPRIHVSCLRLLAKMNDTYEQCFLSADAAMIGQILEAFGAMSGHATVRRAVYTIFSNILGSYDVAELKLSKTVFSALIEQCCEDLKSSLPSPTDMTKASTSKDGFLSTKSTSSLVDHSARRQSEVYKAAWGLLAEIITHCPASMISRQSRIEMDRLSVLLGHQDAMLASVMRPMLSGKGKVTTASLLPFLARSAADKIATDALLRPRMPVTQMSGLSARESRNDEYLSVVEQGEQPDKDDDILSKLEDSLNAMEESLERKEETDTDGVEEHNQEEEMLTPVARKRALDGIEGGIPQESTTWPEISASRMSKMPRLEEKVMEESLLQKNDTAEMSVVKPLASISAEAMTYSTNLEAPVSDTVSKSAAGNDDSDSDFEIPQIDPGFDTDEEESD